MSRYVDVDSLLQKIAEAHGKGDYEANMYGAETYYGLGKWLWEDPEDYGIERCEKIIQSFPTSNVAPVIHAHWTNERINATGFFAEYSYECSACGGSTGFARLSKTSYCPYCGAKMDEGKEDDES